jgi:hypothetical protein
MPRLPSGPPSGIATQLASLTATTEQPSHTCEGCSSSYRNLIPVLPACLEAQSKSCAQASIAIGVRIIHSRAYELTVHL